jgi:hypothetical protein
MEPSLLPFSQKKVQPNAANQSFTEGNEDMSDDGDVGGDEGGDDGGD